MRILLWDIDGTLIKSSKISTSSAHLQALEKIINVKLDRDEILQGATDLEVILYLAEINQIRISKSKHLRILNELDSITLHKIKNREKAQFTVQPGIREVLEYLKLNNFSQGILTGNTQKRAQVKLENANLTSFFSPKLFFYGGNFESRIKFAEFIRKKLISVDIILIGDSPMDIYAAKKNNLKVIAVATGNFSKYHLVSKKPDLAISNFKSGRESFVNFINENL